MLDLRPAHRSLDHFHQAFIDDSAHAVPSELFDRFDRRDYDTRELTWGAEAWMMRVLDEYRSQVGFTMLLADLTQLGFSFDALGTALRVVRDEARHVEICRRLVKTLVGTDVMNGTPAYTMPDPSLPPMRRVLHSVVGALCIGETVSVKLITAVRKATTDPLAFEVMTCLAKDESIHSRFGWILLGLLWPEASADDKQSVLEMLPVSLKAAENVVVPAALQGKTREHSVVTAPMSPFGAISDEERAVVFYDALKHDVLERFESLGISVGHSLSRRKAPRRRQAARARRSPRPR